MFKENDPQSSEEVSEEMKKDPAEREPGDTEDKAASSSAAAEGTGSLGRGGFFDTSHNIGVYASDELMPERRDFLLDYVAEKITKHGMSVPAVMGLEMARPLSFIGSQMLWGAGPLAAIFVNDRYINEIALILEDRNNIEDLILRIEAIEDRKKAEEKVKKQEAQRKKREEREARELSGEKPKRWWWPF